MMDGTEGYRICSTRTRGHMQMDGLALLSHLSSVDRWYPPTWRRPSCRPEIQILTSCEIPSQTPAEIALPSSLGIPSPAKLTQVTFTVRRHEGRRVTSIVFVASFSALQWFQLATFSIPGNKTSLLIMKFFFEFNLSWFVPQVCGKSLKDNDYSWRYKMEER